MPSPSGRDAAAGPRRRRAATFGIVAEQQRQQAAAQARTTLRHVVSAEEHYGPGELHKREREAIRQDLMRSQGETLEAVRKAAEAYKDKELVEERLVDKEKEMQALREDIHGLRLEAMAHDRAVKMEKRHTQALQAQMMVTQEREQEFQEEMTKVKEHYERAQRDVSWELGKAQKQLRCAQKKEETISQELAELPKRIEAEMQEQIASQLFSFEEQGLDPEMVKDLADRLGNSPGLAAIQDKFMQKLNREMRKVEREELSSDAGDFDEDESEELGRADTFPGLLDYRMPVGKPERELYDADHWPPPDHCQLALPTEDRACGGDDSDGPVLSPCYNRLSRSLRSAVVAAVAVVAATLRTGSAWTTPPRRLRLNLCLLGDSVEVVSTSATLLRSANGEATYEAEIDASRMPSADPAGRLFSMSPPLFDVSPRMMDRSLSPARRRALLSPPAPSPSEGRANMSPAPRGGVDAETGARVGAWPAPPPLAGPAPRKGEPVSGRSSPIDEVADSPPLPRADCPAPELDYTQQSSRRSISSARSRKHSRGRRKAGSQQDPVAVLAERRAKHEERKRVYEEQARRKRKQAEEEQREQDEQWRKFQLERQAVQLARERVTPAARARTVVSDSSSVSNGHQDPYRRALQAAAGARVVAQLEQHFALRQEVGRVAHAAVRHDTPVPPPESCAGSHVSHPDTRPAEAATPPPPTPPPAAAPRRAEQPPSSSDVELADKLRRYALASARAASSGESDATPTAGGPCRSEPAAATDLKPKSRPRKESVVRAELLRVHVPSSSSGGEGVRRQDYPPPTPARSASQCVVVTEDDCVAPTGTAPSPRLVVSVAPETPQSAAAQARVSSREVDVCSPQIDFGEHSPRPETPYTRGTQMEVSEISGPAPQQPADSASNFNLRHRSRSSESPLQHGLHANEVLEIMKLQHELQRDALLRIGADNDTGEIRTQLAALARDLADVREQLRSSTRAPSSPPDRPLVVQLRLPDGTTVAGTPERDTRTVTVTAPFAVGDRQRPPSGRPSSLRRQTVHVPKGQSWQVNNPLSSPVAVPRSASLSGHALGTRDTSPLLPHSSAQSEATDTDRGNVRTPSVATADVAQSPVVQLSPWPAARRVSTPCARPVPAALTPRSRADSVSSPHSGAMHQSGITSPPTRGRSIRKLSVFEDCGSPCSGRAPSVVGLDGLGITGLPPSVPEDTHFIRVPAIESMQWMEDMMRGRADPSRGTAPTALPPAGTPREYRKAFQDFARQWQVRKDDGTPSDGHSTSNTRDTRETASSGEPVMFDPSDIQAPPALARSGTDETPEGRGPNWWTPEQGAATPPAWRGGSPLAPTPRSSRRSPGRAACRR
eukprot:TRINITY_DN4267_c0_g1_i4.p1 TRINITY_DN4267_c0_g1~~TRINITY_DN4267_c0_g1_i4.p1  ORF type:complete len:1367 (+),score=383.07 TRINITY_DN4267_c0_g1_i4:56-4102(+)